MKFDSHQYHSCLSSLEVKYLSYCSLPCFCRMEDTNKPQYVDGEDGEVFPNYSTPDQKSIEEIVAADEEDESLKRYKMALLGNAVSEAIVTGI